MDVTSLLNSSSVALQRRDSVASSTPSATGDTTATTTAVPTPSPDRTPSRRTSGSRSPIKNRTPWDAGGYCLPLTLDTKSIQSAAIARPAFYGESPTDGPTSASPKSPKHKFSDSHSSLSSYTSSSNNSISHSRISSLSTVSEFQPIAPLLSDMPLDPRMPQDKLITLRTRNLSGVVDKEPLSTASDRLHHDDSAGSATGDLSHTDARPSSDRPRSPSDAVMIRRGQDDPSATGSPTDVKQDRNSPHSAESSPHLHKRAVSAPDLPPASTAASSFAAYGPVLSQTPESPEQHSQIQHHDRTATLNFGADRHAQYDESSDVDPAADLEMSIRAIEPKLSNREPHCMYTGNACNLKKGPLRKAISHIFGRNKLCTRSIPDNVWPWLCRKHYQRSRYRNSAQYARRQCELVHQAIKQIQAWSNVNFREHHAGVLQDWTLSIRKREQKRLDDMSNKKNAHNKRPLPLDDDSDEDEYDMGRAVVNGTAVPAWLLNRCGINYTTAEMMDIVTEIEEQMENGALTQIPDIEILPNISMDTPDDGRSKMNTIKRKNSTGGHKRSQSMGVSMRGQTSDNYPNPMARRVSQPNTGRQWDHYNIPEKRPRLEEANGYYDEPRQLPSLPPRNINRIVPDVRRLSTMPRRMAFDNIREGHADDRYYNERPLPASSGPYAYGMLSSGPNGPLPAPTPQGLAGPSIGQHSENAQQTNGYSDSRVRSSHQRSYSEVGGGFHSGSQISYRPSSSSSGFPPVTSTGYSSGSYPSVSQAYEAGQSYMPEYTRQDSAYPTGSMSTGMTGYYDDYPNSRQHGYSQSGYFQSINQPSAPMGNGAKHTRHQSTPTVPRPMQMMRDASGPGPLGLPAPSHLMHGQYDHSSGSYHHGRHGSYAATPSAMPRVDETENGSRDAYSSRR
ncbi:hypothetical protein B0H63DRAFT_228974 [Podospora didyma]|uniref:Uncharacterized protein n=1 Tax=Podospora didyma TaxID=330526 RepID=A0AAE0KL27_9PEZI|nr:hypothetical protein B0H63DRAFT_228974 [Podospora didyma]